jgi:enoyl-CoA hydratase/carnithine racemase
VVAADLAWARPDADGQAETCLAGLGGPACALGAAWPPLPCLFIDIYVDYDNAMQDDQPRPAAPGSPPPGGSADAAGQPGGEPKGGGTAQPKRTVATFGDVRIWLGDDLVATAEIRRPPDNFFDVELIAALADAYAWLGERTEARAAVLCSEGRHFCAGADFTGRSAQARPGAGGARELYAEAARLFETQIPVVAAVQGAAVGGGLGLACAADFRVASAQARFCANFARLGLHHGFGLTVTLPAIVGRQRALDLLSTGRRVGGEEAARIGLADRLADPSDLRAAAHQLAAEIAAAAPLAVRSIRATMRAGLADGVREATAHELAEQERLRQTADFAEGIRASAQRRPPRFEGR